MVLHVMKYSAQGFSIPGMGKFSNQDAFLHVFFTCFIRYLYAETLVFTGFSDYLVFDFHPNPNTHETKSIQRFSYPFGNFFLCNILQEINRPYQPEYWNNYSNA